MERLSIRELENKVEVALECRRLRIQDGVDDTVANLKLVDALNAIIGSAASEMTEAENREYRHQLSVFIHMVMGRISGVVIHEQIKMGAKL